jgi:hypothetical protein
LAATQGMQCTGPTRGSFNTTIEVKAVEKCYGICKDCYYKELDKNGVAF